MQLALTDGFDGDTVIVRVDDAEILRREGVTTHLLLGLAEELVIDVPNRPVVVVIELPSRGLSATETVDPTVAAVSVSVEGDRLAVLRHGQTLGFG